MRFRLSRAALLCLSLVIPGLLPAQTPERLEFNPAKPGPGPILFFFRPEDAHGTPSQRARPRMETLYMVDPAGFKQPQMLWRGDIPRPLIGERVTKDQLLIDYKDGMHLVDLSTGAVTPLLAGKDGTRFIEAEGGTIYFTRNTVPDPLRGYDLETGENGKTVVKNYSRDRNLIYRYELGEAAEAQQVSSIYVEKLLAVDKDGFWVITADEPQQILRISRRGAATAIGDFDSQWVACATTHEFSPDRRYLALGVLHRQQDFHEERTLVICDLKDNRAVFTDADIPLGPNLFSGRSMFLDLSWRSPIILACGGPFASLEIEGGETRFVDASRRARLDEAASNFPPPVSEEPPARTRTGLLEVAHGEIYFPGTSKPIASALDERNTQVTDMDTSADGHWGAYCDPTTDAVYLIDGAKREKIKLLNGWSYGVVWRSVPKEQ